MANVTEFAAGSWAPTRFTEPYLPQLPEHAARDHARRPEHVDVGMAVGQQRLPGGGRHARAVHVEASGRRSRLPTRRRASRRRGSSAEAITTSALGLPCGGAHEPVDPGGERVRVGAADRRRVKATRLRRHLRPAGPARRPTAPEPAGAELGERVGRLPTEGCRSPESRIGARIGGAISTEEAIAACQSSVGAITTAEGWVPGVCRGIDRERDPGGVRDRVGSRDAGRVLGRQRGKAELLARLGRLRLDADAGVGAVTTTSLRAAAAAAGEQRAVGDGESEQEERAHLRGGTLASVRRESRCPGL